MLFLKPFLKILIISTILFFVLVYLGMKYHWVALLPSKTDKVALKIPAQSVVMGISNEMKNDVTSENFQPSLIQSDQKEEAKLLENMDKQQVVKACQRLFHQAIKDENLFEIAVGDCVVSNYVPSDGVVSDSATRDKISSNSKMSFLGNSPLGNKQNNSNNIKEAHSTQNRQAQTQRKNATQQCQKIINKTHYRNKIEKQLLMGICVSDKLSE